MNTVEEIRALQKELRDSMVARETGAQAFIRGLTAEVATHQESVNQLPAAQDAAKAQRNLLEGTKAAMEGSIMVLQQEIAGANQTVGELQTEVGDVEEKTKMVDHSSREQVRKLPEGHSL